MGGKSRKGGYVPKNLQKKLNEMKGKQRQMNDFLAEKAKCGKKKDEEDSTS